MVQVTYEGITTSGSPTNGSMQLPDSLAGDRGRLLRALAAESVRSVAPVARFTSMNDTPVTPTQSRAAVTRAVRDTSLPLATRAYVAAAAGIPKPSDVNDAQWAAARAGTNPVNTGAARRSRLDPTGPDLPPDTLNQRTREWAARNASTPTAAGTGNS